ncbi:MAG: hypothetical protein JO318_15365 [Chloroflexi bacterium]|nr:hypothetical protein [Chloroflexota bacterium]
MIETLSYLGELSIDRGEFDAALQLLDARRWPVGRPATTCSVATSSGARWRWTPRADDESLAAARAALGERAFAVAWAAGRQLPLTDAFADALTAEGLDPSPEPLVTAPT